MVQACAIWGTLVFGCSGITYLVLGRWPATYQDFWRIYDTCLNHSWWYSTLLRYNGHSHFFPGQVWLANLRFFHGQPDLLFFVGLSLELLSIVLLVTAIWNDVTIVATERMAAILVVVTATVWMARASMTVTGGFNCCYSLVMSGAALAFLCLRAVAANPERWRLFTFLIAGGGFVASFSFGSGLALWPTVLVLGYCLRVRFRTLLVLALVAVLTATTYTLLPAREVGAQFAPGLKLSDQSIYLTLLNYFCHLLGSPISYAVAAWFSDKATDPDRFASLAVWAGAAGLVLGGFVLILRVLRRDVKSGLDITGLGLMLFNFISILLITIARAEHIRLVPSELGALRYLFWSTLFWAGLLLMLLQRARCSSMRWLLILIALLFPILLFPSHCNWGRRWRYSRYLGEIAATSLINGVRDESRVTILFPSSAQIYRLSKQFRRQQLDMFADGLQNWIGRPEDQLFPGGHEATRLKADCRIDAYLKCDNGRPAARVSGWVRKGGRQAPRTLIIVDPSGTVQGIGQTFSTSDRINRIFYSNRFRQTSFLGYIRNYRPEIQYSMRSADGGKISDEKILIPTPPAGLPTL